MDNRTDCAKCGEPITPGTIPASLHYCKECQVRLGFVPYSTGKPVYPSPQDFFNKQLAEPILDTWILESEKDSERRERDRRRERRDDWFDRFVNEHDDRVANAANN